MTGVMDHCDDKGMEHLMSRPWNILMTCVMELCDDKGMEHCDYRVLEHCDDKRHGAL